MVWSGSRPALSSTSFHLSPSSFHLSPKLGACCRVPGWLVFPSWVLVVGFPAGLPLPFICLPLLFICLPVLFICLPGWVLVVGFPAGLSPTSFHLSPTSFHLSGLGGLSPTSFFYLFPTSFYLSFVSQFFSFVSQAGCLWSGSRLACFPLPSFVSQAGHFLSFVSHFFSLVSQFFSFVSHACGRVPGWLVSDFLSFVSHFFSTVSHFFSLSPRLSASGRVRALFRWPSGVRPFPLMCALFRWPCSISIRLSPRSLTAGVRPFPLAM